MKHNIIHVHQTTLHSLFEYDHITGIVTNKITRNPRAIKGSEVKTKHKSGYYQVQIDGKLYMLHRLLWLFWYGDDPECLEVDHIDHNRTNNSIGNLRLVTSQENKMNRSYSKNSSGHVGVYWDKDREKWVAQIKFNGEVEYLGSFLFKDEAISARKDAEKQYGFHTNHGGK